MNKNLLVSILAIVFLNTLGLAAIMGVTVMRPNVDNTTLITVIVGFMLTTTGNAIAALKSFQNGTDLKEQKSDMKDMKISVDGNVQQLVEHAGRVAALTEQIAAARTAAEVAAKTATDTATALLKSQGSAT